MSSISTVRGGPREPILMLDAGNLRSYPGFGTSWYDLTSNQMTGDLINGPTYSSDGGGSIAFDGIDDKVQISDWTQKVSISGTSARTIQVWVKDEKIGAYNFLGVVSGFGNNGGPGNLFMLTIYADKRIFLWTFSNNYFSTHTISLNTWTNLAVTFSGTAVKIYKNGVPDSGGNISINTINNLPYMIGQEYIGSPYDRLQGKVAQNLVYDRVLSDSEVLQNYNATKTRFGL